MRTPTPAQAANDLRTLARILAAHGPGSWSHALELADAASSPLRAASGGPSSVGDHSDPTASAALHHPDPTIPAVADLVSAYDGVRVALGVHGAASAIWVAGKLQGVAQLLDATSDPTTEWGLLWAAVDQCIRLHTRTITPTAAAAHLVEKDRARTLRRCRVCEAPMPEHDRHDICSADRSLWDDASRNVKGRLRWTHHTTEHHTDWAYWVDWVRARIADPDHVDNRIPLRRPGSPFEPTQEVA